MPYGPKNMVIHFKHSIGVVFALVHKIYFYFWNWVQPKAQGANVKWQAPTSSDKLVTLSRNCSKSVVTNLFELSPKSRCRLCLITSIKIFCISGRKFLLQWSLIIQNNVVLVLCYPKKNRILSSGDNLPPVWEPLF